MKRLNLLAIMAVSIGLTTMIGCTNQTAPGTDAALTSTAIDESEAASVNDQILNAADDYVNALDDNSNVPQAIKSAENSGPQKSAIFSVVVDSVTLSVDFSYISDYKLLVCLDFGTGVTVQSGDRLKGKIYVTLSNVNFNSNLKFTNSERKFEFSDFYINDISVKGFKSVVYNGLNTNSNPYWTITASDTITTPAGVQVIWNSQRVRTRINTNNTPRIFWDDTYAISGSASGVNANGVAYTMTIDENNPLIILGKYHYFVQGSVIITTENNSAVIDYGDGTKDNLATITINGVTTQFTMKK